MILLPGRFTPLAWQPFLILALLLYWPLYLTVERRLLPSTPLNWSLWVILLGLPVNFWVAIDKLRAWQSIGNLMFGIAFFVALLRWPPTQKRPQLIIWFFLWISLGLTVLGPLVVTAELLTTGPLTTIQAKLQFLSARLGETINPNILAGGLTLTLPIQAALALRRDWTQNRVVPVGMGLLCMLTGAVLLLMLSRGADLAVIIALSIIFLLRWPKLIYFIPLIVLGFVFGLYWWGPTQMLDLLNFNAKLGGANGRVEIWSRAIYALHDFVFTGIGIGAFNVVIPQFYPYITIPVGVDIPHAHNLLLQIGVDLGLLGLIAYISLLINIFVMLCAVLRKRTNALSWTLAVGAFGSIVAMLVHGMVDATTWGTKLAFIPWLLFAFVTLLYLAQAPASTKAI